MYPLMCWLGNKLYLILGISSVFSFHRPLPVCAKLSLYNLNEGFNTPGSMSLSVHIAYNQYPYKIFDL